MEESSSTSSEDDCGLQEMKAEAIEKLNCTLIESPASSTFITVSERLALVIHDDTLEPQYYTAPSTPDKLEQELEESAAVSKSKQKSKSKTPEPTYATAPSSPEKAKFLGTHEESLTKSIQERTSKSPELTRSPELTQTAEESVTKPLKKRSSKSPELPASPFIDKEELMQVARESVIKLAKSQKERSSKSPELTASPFPDKKEFIQTGEELVTTQAKSQKRRVSKSPELTVSTFPDKEEFTQMTEESVTKPTKSRKKRSTKSPRPRYVTAPSSPTSVKSKLLPESPQELKKLSSKVKIQKSSSAVKQPSPEITVTLPGNDRERNEFIVKGYDERMEKQLAFMATTFVLQNAIGVKKGLKDLVGEQRWFERKWPSPRSEAEKTKEKIELTPGTAMERREINMLDDVFHGQALLEILWNILDARKAEK